VSSSPPTSTWARPACTSGTAGHYFLAVGLLETGDVAGARAALNRALALGYRPLAEFLRALDKAEQQQAGAQIEGGPASPAPESQ
jgi:hypothetical protein